MYNCHFILSKVLVDSFRLVPGEEGNESFFEVLFTLKLKRERRFKFMVYLREKFFEIFWHFVKVSTSDEFLLWLLQTVASHFQDLVMNKPNDRDRVGRDVRFRRQSLVVLMKKNSGFFISWFPFILFVFFWDKKRQLSVQVCFNWFDSRTPKLLLK